MRHHGRDTRPLSAETLRSGRLTCPHPVCIRGAVGPAKNTSTAIAWFGTVPVDQPWPANVLFAASGAAFGVRATMPVLPGTNLVCILQSLAVGFGYGARHRTTSRGGVAGKSRRLVLLFLAVRFFRGAAATARTATPLRFRDGVIVELLNANTLLIPLVMLQFYDAQQTRPLAAVALTAAPAALTLFSNLVWVVGGRALMALLADAHCPLPGYLLRQHAAADRPCGWRRADFVFNRRHGATPCGEETDETMRLAESAAGHGLSRC